MDKYFRTLHIVADTNAKEYDSIRELTIDIAKSGGYRREYVTLKNGKQVLRTRYNKPATWDDTLVAKWFCTFEKLFMGKLLKHPELSEYYEEILQRTFTIYFNALQIDKLGSDTNVSTVVYMCLNNRIGDVLILKGSEERLKRYNSYKIGKANRKSKDRVNLKTAVNHMSLSLDDENNDLKYTLASEEDIMLSDIVLDISRRLGDNKVGRRLLDAMLYSYKKVDITRVRDYIKLNKDELDKSIASQLTSAYRTIVKTVSEYFPEKDYSSLYSKKANLTKMSKKVYEMEM